ncbi:MAG: segregation/condensation protein A [Spirochaeta sp.]|nr:segregation/condensation protein A [Spirochaeta sp.]
MVQGNSTNSKHEFKLGQFEGPLDLLLFLIKKSEVNIYDIPIAAITEQYLDYLDYTTKVDLDNITEFYVLAATLLYIKSRMLLPVELDLDDEFDDPRTALVEKLIEYQKYRKISELIADQEKSGEWPLEREKQQNILPFVDDEIWQQVNVWDLLQSFSSLISTISSERIIDLYEEVTINEKITLINEFLESGNEFYFTDLLIKPDSIMEIICSFLATLELIKTKRIVVLQNKLFGDIRIKSREKV